MCQRKLQKINPRLAEKKWHNIKEIDWHTIRKFSTINSSVATVLGFNFIANLNDSLNVFGKLSFNSAKLEFNKIKLSKISDL